MPWDSFTHRVAWQHYRARRLTKQDMRSRVSSGKFQVGCMAAVFQ